MSSSASGSGGRYVVAIDFGTTYSGFAYLQKNDAQKRVLKFYEWKDRGGREYCKTITSVYYESDSGGYNFKLVDWGWSALQKCSAAINSAKSSAGHVPELCRNGVTSFKLAGGDNRFACYVEQFKLDLVENKPSSEKLKLPGDLTTERLIVDYLRSLENQIMSELRSRYSNSLRKDAIEWCLTVPSIWGERAKQVMKVCAEKAGLIQGAECPTPSEASPYALDIILEPEGASMYCHEQRKNELNLRKGDRLLIADVGGGTIDLVVHVKAEADSKGSAVKEVVASYGQHGGGTLVDAAFFDFLAEKIGCLKAFCRKDPAARLSIDKEWQRIKTTFQGDSSFSACLPLPMTLRRAWRKHDREYGRQRSRLQEDDEDEDDYAQVMLEACDFQRIFDPEVEKVLRLIKQQVRGVDVLMLVGGFASSVYLKKRVEQEFSGVVKQIVVPPEPGSAICHGAVQLHLQPESIMSRIHRKTYGLEISRARVEGDPQEYIYENDDGETMCKCVFDVFVEGGESVPRNKSVTKTYIPGEHGQKAMTLRVYSASGTRVPKYTSDEGCTLEGSFEINMEAGLKLDKARVVKVTMVFGASLLTFSATGKNFGDGAKVERAFPITFV